MKHLSMCCYTVCSFWCVYYIHADLSEWSRQRLSAKSMWNTCAVLRKLPQARAVSWVWQETWSTSGLSQERSLSGQSDMTDQNTHSHAHAHSHSLLTRKTDLWNNSVNFALISLVEIFYIWNVQMPLFSRFVYLFQSSSLTWAVQKVIIFPCLGHFADWLSKHDLKKFADLSC